MGGGIYEGDFINGIRTGKGRLILKDGSYYEGNFNDSGNYHGLGK